MTGRSILGKWWYKSHDALLFELHGTLYGLVLGILDDVLANTNVHLLSDRIQIDIRPPSESSPKKITVQNATEVAAGEAAPEDEGSSPSGQLIAVFAAGFGVGIATAMAAVGTKRY